ncbi:hypothetical protein P8936_16335 [Edaphobacter paludis]|uniref:Uncharacterized protein n=1 Tax=Edaphobacter paludis TaxID=3035702 RepID=A0AAU7D5Z4_9BACT
MNELTPQQKYSQGLRNLAAWYDEHPDAPCESKLLVSHWFQAKPEEIRAIGSGDKDYSVRDLFYYRVEGDGFKIAFYTSRETVCERKLVGYKEIPARVLPATEEMVIPAKQEPIYEYDCKPLLSQEVA